MKLINSDAKKWRNALAVREGASINYRWYHRTLICGHYLRHYGRRAHRRFEFNFTQCEHTRLRILSKEATATRHRRCISPRYAGRYRLTPFNFLTPDRHQLIQRFNPRFNYRDICYHNFFNRLCAFPESRRSSYRREDTSRRAFPSLVLDKTEGHPEMDRGESRTRSCTTRSRERASWSRVYSRKRDCT